MTADDPQEPSFRLRIDAKVQEGGLPGLAGLPGDDEGGEGRRRWLAAGLAISRTEAGFRIYIFLWKSWSEYRRDES